MPFVIIPIGRRRASPTGAAVTVLILGVLMVGFGAYMLAKGAECDGHTMHEGDTCVYRNTSSGAVDHTTSFQTEARDDHSTGVGSAIIGALLVLGSPFVYSRAQRKRQKDFRRQMEARSAARHAASPMAPSGLSMHTPYAQQLARAAAARQASPRVPLPPPPAATPAPPIAYGPPPPTGPPPSHHDAWPGT